MSKIRVTSAELFFLFVKKDFGRNGHLYLCVFPFRQASYWFIVFIRFLVYAQDSGMQMPWWCLGPTPWFFYPCRSISMLSFWLDANFLYRCPVTQTPTTPPQSAPVPSLAPVQVQDEANCGEENCLVGLKFDLGTLAYLYAITHYFNSLTCQFVTNFSVLFLIIFWKYIPCIIEIMFILPVFLFTFVRYFCLPCFLKLQT